MEETYTLRLTGTNPIEITIPEIEIKVTAETFEEATEKATIAINQYKRDIWLKSQQKAS
jgi:hypothetical protein